jgi:hypothetical protein
MVSAVVLTDFTADGVTYTKGQTISIPKDQYDQWTVNKWVGPGSGSTTVTSNLVGPGSSSDLVGPGSNTDLVGPGSEDK